MPHDVIMPALGMAQDTGLIVSWLKKPGDSVKTGDALMEVETDKAVMEVEAQADGFLTCVKAAAGDHVPVGQVVAIISETAETPTATAATPQEVTFSPAKVQDGLPDGKEIIMPALGMAQDTGLIVAWRKSPGDAVAASDILLEVETDKSVMEVEAGHDGYVAALLADARQAVPVGSVIAIISAGKPEKAISRGMAPAPFGSPTNANTARQSMESALAAQPTAPAETKQGAPSSKNGGRVLASPKARRLAMEQGLDLARLAERGVPEPYHVSDLAALRTLGHASAPQSETTAQAAVFPTNQMHIAARIPASGCDAFIAWMADDGDIHLQPRLLWLRFATAALRLATSRDNDSLVVEIRQLRQVDGRFVDADRSRLSKPVEDRSEQVPALVLHDLTASPIISVTTILTDAPQLTIGRERDDYVISLDYRSDQLTENAGIDLVTSFADRLGEPLRHLL